jgi:hypothetical protein
VGASTKTYFVDDVGVVEAGLSSLGCEPAARSKRGRAPASSRFFAGSSIHTSLIAGNGQLAFEKSMASITRVHRLSKIQPSGLRGRPLDLRVEPDSVWATWPRTKYSRTKHELDALRSAEACSDLP